MASKSKQAVSTSTEEPIAPSDSPLLQTAREQMEAELSALQTTLDRLSDDYADRAETMVKTWLTDCRIRGIELSDFFGNGGNVLAQTPDPEALPPTIEAEVTEC
jgi:hypothetical protein